MSRVFAPETITGNMKRAWEQVTTPIEMFGYTNPNGIMGGKPTVAPSSIASWGHGSGTRQLDGYPSSLPKVSTPAAVAPRSLAAPTIKPPMPTTQSSMQPTAESIDWMNAMKPNGDGGYSMIPAAPNAWQMPAETIGSLGNGFNGQPNLQFGSPQIATQLSGISSPVANAAISAPLDYAAGMAANGLDPSAYVSSSPVTSKGSWGLPEGMSWTDTRNVDGTTTQGVLSPLISGAQAVGNLWAGMKQYDLAKESLAFQKDSFAKNWGAQVQTYNADVDDRNAARRASRQGANDPYVETKHLKG